jgi:hypothetical protein
MISQDTKYSDLNKKIRQILDSDEANKNSENKYSLNNKSEMTKSSILLKRT